MSDLKHPILGFILRNEKKDGSYSFHCEISDGRLKGYFRLFPGQEPSKEQIELMASGVLEAQQLKHRAVQFVRHMVLTEPEKYGLLELDGKPCEWTAPYFYMSEDEYFDDFRLSSIILAGDSVDELMLNFDTELDPEHGVPVLFRDGFPVEAFA